MKEMTAAAANIAKMMNYRVHAEKLNIPILTGFKVEESNIPSVILIAKNEGIMEQLVSDGFIDEPFIDRVNLVINNTKDFMKKTGCDNPDDSFIFYKDYSNGIFDYKLYFCDIIKDNKVVRQLNAYFIEPEMHDFYQLSLSVNAFSLPTTMLKVGKIDLENDKITKMISNLMKILLDNLDYKKKS